LKENDAVQNTIKVGIIGVGGFAHQHIKNLVDLPDAQIVALADIDDGRIAAARERFPQLADVAAFQDYHEMLANVRMDGVVIATPHTLHFEQAMAALDNNLHVLVEKPMVCRVAHAKELIRKSEEKKRVLMIGYQRHFVPQYQYIKRTVEDGTLGDVMFVAALQCQGWKRGTAGTWRQDPALSGGGQLNDSGSHLLDAVLWTTGLSASLVHAFIDNRGSQVDINSALSLEFVGGAQGTISIVGDAPCWHEDFTICGTKGAIFYRNGKLMHCAHNGKLTEPTELPLAGNIDKGFVECILGRDGNWVPPTCGLRVIELTEAAWESARSGKPCTVARA
jgi:predicted dehydrogenase